MVDLQDLGGHAVAELVVEGAEVFEGLAPFVVVHRQGGVELGG